MALLAFTPVGLPFSIRRLWLLVRGALVDRDNPHLDSLASIEDPERFVWAILPHAARSFAPSILLLSEDEARTSAVAYLYARMLDTYEDLSTSPSAAREALSGFADRFGRGRPGAAPPPPRPRSPDARDRTHLLLLERHSLVDDVFMCLAPPARRRIVRLIEDMASGMSEFSTVFERQGGVLETNEQVLDYCRRVIGLPALFAMDLMLDDLTEDQTRDALEVSELIQLANITRDVEKDLRLGVAYHPSLRPHLGTTGSDMAAADVVSARRELILLAAQRAPSIRRLLSGVRLPRLSGARAAAVLMMLFTDNHYRRCAGDVGSSAGSVSRMVLRSVPAVFSSRWTDRILLSVEERLLVGRSSTVPAASRL